MSHVFVVVADHIVCVTATQFSEFEEEKVLIMHTKEAESFEYYRSSRVFETVTELRKHQIKTRWPKEQVALAI